MKLPLKPLVVDFENLRQNSQQSTGELVACLPEVGYRCFEFGPLVGPFVRAVQVALITDRVVIIDLEVQLVALVAVSIKRARIGAEKALWDVSPVIVSADTIFELVLKLLVLSVPKKKLFETRANGVAFSPAVLKSAVGPRTHGAINRGKVNVRQNVHILSKVSG